MNNWAYSALRVSVFPLIATGKKPASAGELFKSIWGVDAEASQTSAPTNGFPVTVASGSANGFGRVCQAQPVRVDFTLTPLGNPSSDFPLIENHIEAFEEIRQITLKLKQAFVDVPCERVAVYLQLSCVAANYADANKLVLASMPQPFKLPLGDREDFIFQINEAKYGSSPTSIKFNYISKWTVDRVQVFTMFGGLLPGGEQPGGMPMPLLREKIVASASLDFNCSPLQRAITYVEFDEIRSALLTPIPRHFKAFNIEFAGT